MRESIQDQTPLIFGQERRQDESAHTEQAKWDRQAEYIEDVEAQARLYGNESSAYDNAIRKWLRVYRDERGIDDTRPDSDTYRGQVE